VAHASGFSPAGTSAPDVTSHLHHGPDTHPEAGPAAPRTRLDEAVAAVRANRDAWITTSPAQRVALIDRLMRDVAAVADEWIAACVAAEGLDPRAPESGEEALVGPYFVIRNLRRLRRSLSDVGRGRAPAIPGPIRTRPGGQLTAGVFPGTLLDRLFYPGIRADVWMEPGVTADDLTETQAVAYRERAAGRVCLVLGGGNVSSIGPMDVLHKLFVENQVVVLKTHPVNGYLAPILERGLSALVERGVLRIVQGGSGEGAYLCTHPGIDEIHITGSDRTYEAIVFGPGEEGERRRERGEPITRKRVTAELGNVSPVIVVPGEWSRGDLERQAENVATMLTNNAGFNCNAARVLVTSAGWPQRTAFLQALGRRLDRIPARRAWYPGAAERHARFVGRRPQARLSPVMAPAPPATPGGDPAGVHGDDRLPWALIPGVDPADGDDPCFTTEAFCGVFAETALPVADPAEFLAEAVRFANGTLWGTLNVTILVHPGTERQPGVAAALDRAIADLRYGTVAVNGWAALGYGLVVNPWGAFPGSTPADIQSGTGFVHDTLMLSRAQKTVVRAPFRPIIKPVWFAGHRTTHRLAPRLAQFEAAGGLAAAAMLPSIVGLALIG
jgi:acyl-CoA reductase-like NAD-dependent aldehyde dehydrogenase